MMTKYKKIGFTILWCTLGLTFIITLGFVNRREEALICKDLDININYEDDNFFVDESDIKQIIRRKGDSVIRQPLATVNIPDLEKTINAHSSVEKAEVYVTINGELKVDVEQRKPLIRIINKSGDSYYMDNKGKLMPLSDKYTARVLIANGNIEDTYALRYKYDILDYENKKELQLSVLDDLYKIVHYISNNEFWAAQVQQIFVNENKEFELVPSVGDHRIIFGDGSDVTAKFNKLMTFYKEGLNATGAWNKYTVINLKYKNQIVCTKK